MSKLGHRLAARRGEHLACRFARNGGQDARPPHSQDGMLQSLASFFNRAI
jgi:hypothetical protein